MKTHTAALPAPPAQKNGSKNTPQKSDYRRGGHETACMEPKTAIRAGRCLTRAVQAVPAGRRNRKTGTPGEMDQNKAKNPAVSAANAVYPPNEWNSAMGTAPDGSYWTLNTPHVSDEIRIAWKLGPKRKHAPHSGLGSTFLPSLKALRAYYKDNTDLWEKTDLQESCQLVRVETAEAGLNMVMFPSYAAALAAVKARAQLAKLAAAADAAVPDLKPCPFCRKSDRLQIVFWSHERNDWTSYDGDAVKCNRCDCIVPLAAWQKRADLPTPT